MKLVTAEEMRRMDKRAAEEFGVSELALMENAGREIAAQAADMGGEGAKICIVAGHGNNGGDGFAAARHLMALGFEVEVFFSGSGDKLKASGRTNYEILRRMKAALWQKELQDFAKEDFQRLHAKLERADVVVDALLGTGMKLPLRDGYAHLFALLNESAGKILSVDVPSGIDADCGAIDGIAVKATRTVTFGLPKVGMYFYPAASFCGEIVARPIGMPKNLLDDGNIKQNLMNTKMVRHILGVRKPYVHKGNCGRVVVVAGSKGMTGAAALAAEAALRSGAGLATLFAPASLQPVLAAKLTEVMTSPLPEEDGALAEAAGDVLPDAVHNADVVLLGPGLGRSDGTQAAIRKFLAALRKPTVIDADALFALRGQDELLRRMDQMPILTPHVGEMAALTGKSASSIAADMVGAAKEAARRWNAVVVLKSARTVVAYPSADVYINSKGNAGMATGGSGDVLAGAIAGLLAQKMGPMAAVAGVFLHAAAGDLAAENGMEGLLAGDILAALPKARSQTVHHGML